MCEKISNFAAEYYVYSNFGKYRCRENNADKNVGEVLRLGTTV